MSIFKEHITGGKISHSYGLIKNTILATLITIMAVSVILCGCGQSQNLKTQGNDGQNGEVQNSEEFSSDVKNQSATIDFSDGPEEETGEDGPEIEDGEMTCQPEESGNVIEFEDKTYEIAEIYEELLSGRESMFRYGAVDIDSDGITEFLISEGDYHAAEVMVYKFRQDNHEAEYIGSFGGWGELGYIPEEGCIVSGYLGQGEQTTIVVKIDGYEAVEVMNFWDNSGAVENGVRYTINDKDVAAGEYEKLLGDYYGDNVIYLRYDSMYEIKDKESNLETIRELLGDTK